MIFHEKIASLCVCVCVLYTSNNYASQIYISNYFKKNSTSLFMYICDLETPITQKYSK